MSLEGPGSEAKLLVGFDSAWTPNNSGALVGVLHSRNGEFEELGPPRIANFREAEGIIAKWQNQHKPSKTIVLLDQPTIVGNAVGQRPVENIVASPVSLRYGGVQPANTSRIKMFGNGAPIWDFLSRFGGPASPLEPWLRASVFETYPVLSIIALDWTLPDSRATGRLPKYNPSRKKTFSISDWAHVCNLVASKLLEWGLFQLGREIQDIGRNNAPRKQDQDCLDACICLIAALYMVKGEQCLMVGNMQSGYITVPYGKKLHGELVSRCISTDREVNNWVHVY